MRKDLSLVFSDLAKNASKIAPCLGTNTCESMNNMIRAKASNANHFSSSGNLTGRVDCAVGQEIRGMDT